MSSFAVPGAAGYMSPGVFLLHSALAARKLLRSTLPHFAVVKRRVVRRMTKNVDSRNSSFHQVDPPAMTQRSRTVYVASHLIRLVPQVLIECFSIVGAELSLLPFLSLVLRRGGILSRSRAALWGDQILLVIEQLAMSATDLQSWTLMAELIPSRMCGYVALRCWVRALITLDEWVIVPLLRSSYLEKWWLGMCCRIATQSVLDTATSLFAVVLARQWLSVSSDSRASDVAGLLFGDKERLFCGALASLAAAAIKYAIVPKALVIVQRIVIWSFEEVEYVLTRRYKQDTADDVDDVYLTPAEIDARRLRLQEQHRTNVIRAVCMRAVALVLAKLLIGHPLQSLQTVLQIKSVGWLSGVILITPGNRFSSSSRSAIDIVKWAVEQVAVECTEILGCLVQASDVAEVISTSERVHSVDTSLNLLLARLVSLKPLFAGWQWTIMSTLAVLRVSTAGRMNIF